MTTAVQHRRGTTAEHAVFTGLEGEVTIDTTKDTAVIHDGTLAGGYPLAKENLANVTTSGLSSIDGASTASDDKFFIYDQSATSLKTITRAELNNAIEQDALANVAITGGTINGTTIGGTTAAAVSATTLTTSSTVTHNGGTANSVCFLNGSKVLTTGSALTFDGTNLGVGVASPGYGVDLRGASGVGIQIFETSTGNNNRLILTQQATVSTYNSTFSTGSGAHAWQLGGSEQMRLTSTGLGIGNSSPTAKLDVTGTAAISGAVTLSGGTANGVAYLNGSKVLTTGSALNYASGTGVGNLLEVTGGSNNVNGQLNIQGTDGTNTSFVSLLSGLEPTNLPSVMFNNGLRFAIATNKAASGYSEQMRLTSTGLGIGTSSPATKLDVSGVVRSVVGSGHSFQALRTSDFYYSRFTADGIDTYTNTNSSAPMLFKTGGAEKMRLDSSGNLGLGVTPSAWGSNYRAVEVSGAVNVFGNTGDANFAGIGANLYHNNTNYLYRYSTLATMYLQDNGTHQWHTAPSGTAGNAISFTQAMTLDASGNLGVGTTSPQATIVAAGSNATVYKAMILRNGNGSDGSSATIDFETSAGTQGNEAAMAGRIAGLRTGSGTSGALTFSTTSGGTLAERARIDSSGNLLVGQTSVGQAGVVSIKGLNGYGVEVTGNGGSALNADYTFTAGTTGYYGYFKYRGTLVGSISSTGSTTTYATSSDYRLKENIAPMTGALAKVAALKPVTYTWKADGSAGEGFIAHELAEVCPAAVTGEKDAVDADGNPQYQGIDVSFLVGTLTAAIQEQQAIIEDMKNRLAAAGI